MSDDKLIERLFCVLRCLFVGEKQCQIFFVVFVIRWGVIQSGLHEGMAGKLLRCWEIRSVLRDLECPRTNMCAHEIPCGRVLHEQQI